ncbi:hypothetical protein BDD12DRAFT_897560 [Trichophaea hybrida]|nr:hypothetical protein BDD12DRAFT_897560 [Trichophaea hybrida]
MSVITPTYLSRAPLIIPKQGDSFIDITDPEQPSYTFLWAGEALELLSVSGYLQKCLKTPQQQQDRIDSIVTNFAATPLIHLETLRKIWPLTDSIIFDESPQSKRSELRELSIKKLIISSLDQEDVAWFDSCDWDMFPDLPRAIVSHLSTLIEQGVDVMKTSPSAGNLLWRASIFLNKKSNVLNLSTPLFNTMAGGQIADLFRKLFGIDSRHGSQNFTVERLIIFGAPLFNPAELQLFSRSTKETPDILQINTTTLSASAFLKIAVNDILPEPPLYLCRSYDFTTIKPHPACIPSPGTVSSIVLFFPTPVYDSLIIPKHFPFAFAHPRTTAMALLNFFKCLNTDGRILLNSYFTAGAHILKEEYRERKARYSETVLETPGWALFVSILPAKDDDPGVEKSLDMALYVRRERNVLEILSIPEIVGVDGMEDLKSDLWENEISRGFVKTRAGKDIPIRLLTEHQVRMLE